MDLGFFLGPETFYRTRTHLKGVKDKHYYWGGGGGYPKQHSILIADGSPTGLGVVTNCFICL